jgi:PIN domain nuclease of toxin-antitoxin system
MKSDHNELWLSPVSMWEALSLHARNKINLGSDVAEWFTAATAGTHEAPLTHDIARAAVAIQMHRDPADRFLAATAQVLDLTLVTADEKLLGLGTIRTLANR